MKLLTILFTLLLSASALAQEDKITVSGFWAGMSASEFEANCIARGYYCFVDESYQVFNKPPNGDDNEVMESQWVQYVFSDRTSTVSIKIPCRITNTCSMSDYEVADLLVSQNIVSFCDQVENEYRNYPVCLKDELENGTIEVHSISFSGRNFPSIYIKFFLTPNFN